MDITLLLAKLRFRFRSEWKLDIDSVLNNFILPTAEDPDIDIRISRDWDLLALPQSPLLGEDALCSYYRQGDTWFCLTKGGIKGPVACSVYSPDYREIQCVLNEKPFLCPVNNLGSILRLVPLRAVFQHFGVLFFHASRICYQGCAILFTAASGTGKTTQAKLWNQYRGAEILCNDRTLLRKTDGTWQTYGFPLDGSEPVRSSAMVPLGAVVLLAQGTVNRVERLAPGRGTAMLMNQMVIDSWNPEALRAAMEALFSLISDVPVYFLTCTPDKQAVEALQAALLKDEVIPHG